MDRYELNFIGGSILAIVLFFIGAIWLDKTFEWITESAQIERLRIDAKKVDSKMAEDVAGQVSAKNQKIAEMQRWRKTAWRLIIPSGWDSLKPIEMPKVSE